MTTVERRSTAALLTLLVVRLAAMAAIPLNESTEARYGEMARKMLETGNWVLPMHDYGIPFLAKPPLWAWMSAASMGIFGVSAFAARLPALLLSIMTLGLVWLLALKRHGRGASIGTPLVLAASAGFFVAAGTVMTDPALAFSTTLVLASFWLAIRYEQKFWGWMFFAGCGVGLLAKGPVALVIAGMPVFFWTLWRKEWVNLWRRLPWIGGSLLALAIAAPWYALAQIRAPEFLSYFLIGEHIHKFLEPGWNGDRYGFAHAFPHGTIWVFALLCFLPWSAAVPALTGPARSVWKDEDGWMLFLALWSCASLVFFTLAANIIWPYPLPALPGLALLFTELMLRLDRRIPIAAVYATALAGAAATLGALVMPHRFDHSERDMIAAWRGQAPAPDSRLLFWGYTRIEFSAAFYSSGRAITTSDDAAAEALLSNGTRDYIVSTPGGLERLPLQVREGFEDIGHYENGRGVRILLRENAGNTAGP